MKKIILTVLSAFFILSVGFSQKEIIIKLNTDKNNSQVKTIKDDVFSVRNSFSKIKLTTISEKKNGNFIKLSAQNLIKTFNKGNPDLPVYSRLIEVPQDAKVKLTVVSYDEEIINLSDKNIYNKIMPAQPSLRKDKDPEDVPFYYNEKVYKTDAFYSQGKHAVYEEAGQMRDVRLGRIEIRPFEYNPVTNQLKVLNNILVKVEFIGADFTKTEALKRKYASPFFSLSSTSVIYKLQNKSKELIQYAPVTFVIVADRSFESALQPFVQWKTLKGFKVIEAYTDDPNVGNTVASIKAYLQDLYYNPPTGQSPPSFILVVGDIDKVPATQHSEVADSPYSDLDLAEYTGDYLPEVNYGRWSADDAVTVEHIVYKTIRYEKLEMPDISYLKNTFLLAGNDEGNEDTYGGGAMWYGNEYYFNPEHNINNHLWLQDTVESWSGGNTAAHDSIIYQINNGVAFANYTAHCSSDGWADPSFSQNDLNNYITNVDKYGIWVGNCCQSNMFNVNEAFAELAIRKENAGVVGYIGGSQYTYWDEDYWWGVGIAPIKRTPSYEESTEGCFDGLFHDKVNEVNNISAWYETTYQFNKAGLLAVEASTSGRKPYYWVIYQVAGDPSIMPFVGTPQPMPVATSPAAIVMGTTSLNVYSVPYSYVALSQDGILIATAVSDASGNASLSFASDALSIGNADLVVTAQNRVPHIGTISVSPANEPYVVLDSYTTSASPDYGQSITLNVTLENVTESGSGYNALNTNATLSLTDPYITVNDGTENYGTIAAGATKLIDNAFSVTIADNVPDQYQFSFDLTITGQDGSNKNYTWPSKLTMTANAPVLKIGSLIINDAVGNGNGILDPGETADIIIETSNKGHVDISNTVGTLSYSGSDLTVNSVSTSPFNLSVNETQLFVFNVTVNNSVQENTPVTFQYSVSGGENSQYTENKDFNLILNYKEYCESRATSPNDSRIENVIFGEDVLNSEISNNTTSDGCSTYSDFSYMTANVVQGGKDSLILTIGTCSGDWSKGAKVFVDWNGDYDFDDTNEEVFVSNTSSSTFTDTVEITVPNDAKIGNVRMRIVCKETSDASNITACGTYSWGETEDYTLNISPGITQGGILTANNSQICIGDNTGDINLSNNSGTVTDWEKKLESSSWISVGYSGTIYSEIPAEPGTWYYRAVIDNGAAYSDSASIIVNSISVGGNTSSDTTICEGDYINLTLSNQSGTITNWERQLNGSSWEYIFDTQTSLSEEPSEDGSWLYRTAVKNGACPTSYSDTTSIIVNPSAVSGIIDVTNADICTGSQVTLTADGYDGTIQWQQSVDGIDWTDITDANSDTYTSDILSETTYFRTVTSLGFCNDSISYPKEIKVYLNPVADFSYKANNQEITFTNTSENATNYLWSFGDGYTSSEENPVYLYETTSTYTVTLTASNKVCNNNKTSKDITVTNVGINQIKSGISIAPNPNNGFFTVKINNLTAANSFIEIYSMSGKLIYQKNINSDVFNIDLSNQAKGIYFVRIIFGNQIINSKLMIE
ncbi:MAG: T9SS type A sorting domain-containing protein [Chlorobi bacterium]|nr:T9SS type A sorting domain-containing protein [Chlorobiota bacterium]